MANVLIIGSGGREHALGWKLAQSPQVREVLYLNGNAGTAAEAKARNLPAHFTAAKEGFVAIDALIETEGIDLAVVGPEQPLVDGLVDYLQQRERRVFGPSAAAARLEADKFFSYEIMLGLGIPQARSLIATSSTMAKEMVDACGYPEGIVLKAAGLTGGKGVTVFDSKADALAGLEAHINAFGPRLLVAERLYGEEFSVFGISDGQRVHPILASFQDHKRLNNGDQGPNTGGMGAYGPANHVAPLHVVQHVADAMMTPVVQKLARCGAPYTGFLYAGMMMTRDGPKVLEYNVRMGDPECQPAMMLLESDLYELLSGAIDGNVPPIELKEGAACCVVLASPGYPGTVEKGRMISGLEETAHIPGVKVFHAGTKLDEHDRAVTNGGRVLGVTAYLPEGIAAAQQLAYETAEKITIRGGSHYRRDIASRALGK